MTEPVTYNPFEPGFTADPYPQYAAMRASDPVHLTLLEFWVLFAYEDIARFLKDPTLSVEDANARPTAIDQMIVDAVGDRADRGSHTMLNLDPPDHTRLRKLVTKAFTPRVVENLRPRVQALVDDMLDDAGKRGEMDLIADYAFPLPFAVISEMLGVPATDGDKLRAWSGLIVRSLEPIVDTNLAIAIADASDHMYEYVGEMIERKRKEPADDLLSADFGKLDVEDLFKAAIFKVDSKFMREMKASGFPNLGMEELVKARIFKIDAGFVSEVARMGFDKEPFESLVKMRIFKVTPEFINEARGEGLTNLSVEDLVKMRIFKIDGEFIRQARAEGVPLEVEKLVQKRIGVWGK